MIPWAWCFKLCGVSMSIEAELVGKVLVVDHVDVADLCNIIFNLYNLLIELLFDQHSL